MMPPTRIEQLNNFQDAVQSPDGLDRLRALQAVEQALPSSRGLMGMPQVQASAPQMQPMINREDGGMLKEDISIKPMNLEEQAMMMQQVEQQQPREINPQIQNTAQGLASLGRGGDNMLLHINPAELQGLASMLNVTINPTTGMPEIFLNRIVRAVRKIAPVALALAAPALFGGFAASLGLGGTALGSGITGFIGSGLGSLIAGAKPKDALKAGLMGGVTSGALAGIQGKPFATSPKVYQGSIGPTLPDSQALTKTGLGTTMGNVPTEAASQFGTNIPSGTTTATDTFSGLTNTQPMTLLSDPLATVKSAGQSIVDQLGTTKGIAKAVGYDLMTPDYELMYANEAKAKEQALQDAGYTVDTGFDGQTVIKDSSGVTMPRTLSVQQILDRALGRAPRTNLVARYGYGAKDAKEGGLISLKHGGEFSGIVPGEGHGMEDNVYMPITEGKEQVGTLAVSPSEYVVDSYTMAALGNGNADAGAKVMDRVVKHVRKKAYGDTEQPNEISGLQALKPMMERV
jgi:hypothetical protein